MSDASPKTVLRPCDHLLAARPGDAPIVFTEVLDAYDGAVVVLVGCPVCDATGILELLDWDDAGPRRIFRYGAVAPATAAQFIEKAGRPTCKLDQRLLEIEALLSVREPTSLLVALSVPDRTLLAAARVEGGERIPTGAWRDALPAVDDEAWFRRLGLEKRSV